MKLAFFNMVAVSPDIASAPQKIDPSGYIAGILIAIFILGYLVFSILKPEKF